MKALTITDLSLAIELDATAMKAVHGGMFKGYPMFAGPSLFLSSSDIKFDASQQLMQEQNTLVNNGNNVAFAHGITATVTPSQNGSNNIHFR